MQRRAFFSAVAAAVVGTSANPGPKKDRPLVMRELMCPHDGCILMRENPVGYTRETRFDAPVDAPWLHRCGCGYTVEASIVIAAQE